MSERIYRITLYVNNSFHPEYGQHEVTVDVRPGVGENIKDLLKRIKTVHVAPDGSAAVSGTGLPESAGTPVRWYDEWRYVSHSIRTVVPVVRAS